LGVGGQLCACVPGTTKRGRLIRIVWDYGSGGVQVAYEYGYNSDGARMWKRDRRDMQNEQEYRYVCGIGCGWLPLVIYRDYDGADEWAIWERYEWTTDLLRGFWYEGYEFGPTFTWRNLDYELLAGYLWVADLWLDFPGGGFRMRYWDRYGLVVGERFYPAKPKEQFFGRRESGDVPTKYRPTDPSQLPKPKPPIRIPELPENPVPFTPNPTGPINVGIRFCNAMIGTGSVIPVGSTCRHFVYDTPEGAFWCVSYPKCSGNPLCCVKECARILCVDPEQTINDWVGAYCKLWENIQ